jgi:hypothetical protein
VFKGPVNGSLFYITLRFNELQITVELIPIGEDHRASSPEKQWFDGHAFLFPTQRNRERSAIFADFWHTFTDNSVNLCVCPKGQNKELN